MSAAIFSVSDVIICGVGHNLLYILYLECHSNHNRYWTDNRYIAKAHKPKKSTSWKLSKLLMQMVHKLASSDAYCMVQLFLHQYLVLQIVLTWNNKQPAWNDGDHPNRWHSSDLSFLRSRHTLDKVMFALVNVGEFGILGKQPHANLSFSRVTQVN